MTNRIVQFIVGLILIPFAMSVSPWTATASEADCTGTPEDPIYPDYPSGTVLQTFTNDKSAYGSLSIPIRHGFYCVPAAAQGNLAAEYDDGIGFGLDKVQNRHHIGQPPIWNQSEAIRAVKAVLNSSDVRQKQDPWGTGYTMHTWTSSELGCTYDNPGPDCDGDLSDYMHVVASVTTGGAANEPQGGMPAGQPLGLQTVYCDQDQNGDEDPGLRCSAGVTGDLVEFSYELGL